MESQPKSPRTRGPRTYLRDKSNQRAAAYEHLVFECAIFVVPALVVWWLDLGSNEWGLRIAGVSLISGALLLSWWMWKRSEAIRNEPNKSRNDLRASEQAKRAH